MKTFVHLGLPKTGTTFLQQVLFKNHKGINYLGKNGSDDNLNKAISGIVRLGSNLFDIDTVTAKFKEQLSTVNSGLPILLSEEDLSRYLFLDPELMASRLRYIFGEFHPLYVIRNPVDWLQSLYFFRLSLLHPDALNGPDNWLAKNLKNHSVGSETNDLYYGKVAALYRRYSGVNKINVFCYEDLMHDRDGFISNLSDIIGIDVKESIDLVSNSSENKNRDKIRINQNQADFLCGCKLLNTDYNSFVRHIEKFLAISIQDLVTSTVQNEFKYNLESKNTTLDNWASLIKSINRILGENNSPPAEFLINDEQKSSIYNLCRRQARSESSLPYEKCLHYNYFG